MKKVHVLFLACVLMSTTSFAQRKYVGWSSGYLPNYANFAVSKVNWKCYTHLFWFSINANSSGVVGGLDATTAKNFTSACHQNNTKAIICVGGAGAAGKFETACANATILNTFVNSMVSFMQSNNFDGIDIDWEDDGNGITASKYLALFQGLSTALGKIAPKPLLTAAVADYYATASAPVYPYADQMNIMSYYDLVSSSPQEIAAFTGKGVPKAKLGIGYGYDVDNEKDVNNPNDIGAKCLFSINNACGGIMVWEIDKACVACDDTTAYYVNKNATGIGSSYVNGDIVGNSLTIKSNRIMGQSEICYTVPGSVGSVVDLSMFDASGNLVRTLVHGLTNPGPYSVQLRWNNSLLNSGVYIFKLRANSKTAATKAFVAN